MNMNLREFMCNQEKVNAAIRHSDRIKSTGSTKLLGITWNYKNDTFVIPLKTSRTKDLWIKKYEWDDPLDEEDLTQNHAITNSASSQMLPNGYTHHARI
ncbi:hypothetical protein Aduo_001119 [Ancylostoma duodenale]